ncbi:hypothetical protein J41TS2_00550 [Bacillus sonorensis]|nr:hypothetical protein J41TS2_00550 [Bacillus sonorensis]
MGTIPLSQSAEPVTGEGQDWNDFYDKIELIHFWAASRGCRCRTEKTELLFNRHRGHYGAASGAIRRQGNNGKKADGSLVPARIIESSGITPEYRPV